MVAETKICRLCPESGEQPLLAFPRAKSTRDGRRGECKRCTVENTRRWRAENRAKVKEHTRQQKYDIRERNTHLLLVYFGAHPCVDCPERDPLVLDFDHRDPSTKLFNVGTELYNRRWESLLLEIEKCDVRCANCHRRKTAAEAKTFKWQVLTGCIDPSHPRRGRASRQRVP